jgi:hypothetical protein
VFSLSQGQTMSGIAVSEDGRILVAPDEWLGELYTVSGRFN